MASVSLEELCAFDAVVFLNGCDRELLLRLRGRMGGGRKLILWTQHAADQPAVANLAEAELRDCLDGVAFVSQWQMDGYLDAFRLDPARCRVMRNGIAPAFAGLFGPDEDIRAVPPWPPVLAYTSTPFRGLDVLLDSFPSIRAAIPGTRLRVCSSLEGYQVAAGQDPFTALYQRCRETEGVEYLGGLGQVALAGVLREATCLAYPNRFAETSCIAVLEALAAGCLVVSSQLGALPESGAGFARLTPVPEDPREHARRYAEAAVAALTDLRTDPGAGLRLRAQVDHANAETSWPVRAQGWIAWFEELSGPAPVRADAANSATAITARIASAQQQLMEALGAHLNSGPTSRLADPAWRAEARGMIDLVERSLRLDHNDEEARTGVWSALRGYDAWLSYHTALPDLPPPSPPPPGGRRIFDCFQFHNELDLLEVRLAELHPVVDRFVLVEATYTHAGAAKPLHYADNRARFAAYADKIIHIVVAEDPGGFAWNREAYQRDAILRGLGECRPSDMILISDADEILRAPVVERLRREPDEDAGTGATLFAPHLDIFLYFLDLKAPDPWVSVAAAPWELIRRIGANRARYLAKQGIGRVVPDAGWHFTWMGGADRFRAKLEAFAHREMIAGFDRDPQANQARLDRFYATGRFDGDALPGMWTGLQPVPVDERYPARIRETLSRFRRLGWLIPQAEPAPEALLEEGWLRERDGDGAAAEALWRRAAALDPTDIQVFHALAERLLARNATAEALRPLRCCTRLDPEGSFHLFKLAHSLLLLRRYGESATVLRALIQREPEEHRAYGNLAVALKNLGRHGEAVAVGRQALALAPADAGLLGNLGLALSMRIGGGEAAADALSRAMVLEPDRTETRMNRALVLRNLHRLDEAEAECRHLVAERPDDARARTLLATCLLMRGDLAGGFRAYEWRTRLADGQMEARGLPTPLWEGGDPDGRRILLHDEQGLGDGIQFARYATLLARRGAHVIVECNDALARLLATLPGVATVVGRSAPTPAHDAHAALMSLPHLLGTTLATVPSEVPYLAAEPSLVARWRDRLEPVRAGLRGGLVVGLVWAGNAELPDDPKRSPGLEPLLPLLGLPGIVFVSLQKGDGRADLERLGGRLPEGFHDVGDALEDLADTAAVVAQLDLVISVDSAVAHLAGALGRKVWTMVRAESEWRWMLERADSPWYPTMRLFRQKRAGDWSDVVAALRGALHQAVREAPR
ncbi:Flp pilus assembly protein TadD/glycosyltransferase involved in cell wall biosynthesis [Azospirillum agricola]|uniref:glycosyltransferase n=1 Tax=Azospirillum agricola TaxID=1720247 RepID=UPI001AE60AB8|nr:glycosyltransferase [Azospirillum agricola]MBP2228907.1 Flp pilus assembly protein TadD/glycosyltransferase involved in cell wall biosynthesis [Azospirillum agricola]